MQPSDPVGDLHRAFERARERQRAMIEREGRAPAWPGSLLEDEDHRAAHGASRAIRANRPDVFALYAGELSLIGAILDVVEDAAVAPTLAELAEALEAR